MKGNYEKPDERAKLLRPVALSAVRQAVRCLHEGLETSWRNDESDVEYRTNTCAHARTHAHAHAHAHAHTHTHTHTERDILKSSMYEYSGLITYSYGYRTKND